MRFRQFLVEHDSVESLINEIAKDCTQFLTESKSLPLYRGIIGSKSGFYPHPKNRQPKDTTKYFNWWFDAFIQSSIGEKQLRAHTLFGTGSYDQASEYGEKFFCFPKGTFKLIYSPIVNDAIYDGERILKHIVKHLNINLYDTLSFSQLDLILYQIFEYYHLSADDWVNGSAYIKDTTNLVAKNFLGLTKSTDNFYDDLKHAFADTFNEIFSDDLYNAIKSHNEIMFYETDGYYLISLYDVKDMMIADGLETPIMLSPEFAAHAYEYLLNKIEMAK